MRGGVVFKAGNQLHFLPALAVQQIGPLPPITRIPSAPAGLSGVAQSEGEIVPVIDLREGTQTGEGLLIVCSYMGEPIGVIGAEVVGIGHYEVDPEQPDAIIVGEKRARPLDLGKLYARMQTGA